VHAVPRPGEPDRPGTDAAVTALPGVALAVLTADCVPVLLADPQAGVVGVAHAGRVGAAAGVLSATLAAMEGLGARMGDCEALLGPAVCGACYEVPAEMRDEVGAALPGSATRTRRGTPGLDLRAGLRAQLAALGVAKVGVDPRCTVEDPDLYSYRRDRRTGRLAAVTWLDPSR
jgi:polyphenol oxidase